MSAFDKRVLSHLQWQKDNDRIGTRTWKLADRHGCTVSYMRRALVRLEKSGLVSRHERYSANNDIFWQIAQ
jgi:DNA-binding IscR family transcriptional regulator